MPDRRGALDRLLSKAGLRSRPPIPSYHILLLRVFPIILLRSLPQIFQNVRRISTPIVVKVVLMRFWNPRGGGITCRDTVGKRVFHQCSERFVEFSRGGPKGRDTVGGADQVFHDMAEQVDDQDVHGVRGQETCIGEVTEEDMLHKLLVHEERGHDEDDEDAGRVVFLGKGNGSLPWSDEEEWE